MRAEIGDQLVRRLVDGGPSEIVGTVIGVSGDDGGSPFTVRWHDDGHTSDIDPDPERYWLRSHVESCEVGRAMRGIRCVA